MVGGQATVVGESQAFSPTGRKVTCKRFQTWEKVISFPQLVEEPKASDLELPPPRAREMHWLEPGQARAGCQGQEAGGGTHQCVGLLRWLGSPESTVGETRAASRGCGEIISPPKEDRNPQIKGTPGCKHFIGASPATGTPTPGGGFRFADPPKCYLLQVLAGLGAPLAPLSRLQVAAPIGEFTSCPDDAHCEIAAVPF